MAMNIHILVFRVAWWSLPTMQMCLLHEMELHHKIYKPARKAVIWLLRLHPEMEARYAFDKSIISGIPRNFVRGGAGGAQQIHLRTEDRENGDLGAVAP